jgi:HEAT repeat protein
MKQFGSQAGNLLPEVFALLAHENERVRAKAAEELAWFGPPAKLARPQLERMMNDKWEFVRDAARASMQALDQAVELPELETSK